jgi:hypothetical protein
MVGARRVPLVGPVGGRHEREADRTAREVVRGRVREAPSRPGTSARPRPRSRPAFGPRSGGRPLPESVRHHMEQGLGADLGGVRLHTDGHADQVSRLFGARSLTTGHDIYFRRGQYAPGSEAGRELLAHELTHVVQQSAGDTPAVQRKIGFEFETAVHGAYGWGQKATMFTSTRASSEPALAPEAWKIVRDTGIEFVTQPFELDLPGYRQMTATMDDIARFVRWYEVASRLSAQRGDETLHLDLLQRFPMVTDAPTSPFLAEVPKLGLYHGIEHYSPRKINANPQATVGTTLHRIPALVGDLGTEDLADAIRHPREAGKKSALGGTTLVGAYPPAETMVPEARRIALREAAYLKLRRGQQDPQTQPPVTPDDYGHYAGFVALVLTYIIRGLTQARDWDYTKVMPLAMSRTALSDVLARMVHPALGAELTWPRVRTMLRLVDATTVKLYPDAVDIDDELPLFRQGIENDREASLFLVRQWIESLHRPLTAGKKGMDLISASEDSMHGHQVQNLEDTPGGKLLPLELRQLPRQVRPEDWKRVAVRLFLIARKWQRGDPTRI